MKLRDILFIIILNAIWGGNFVAVKITLQDFSPFLTNMVRFALAFIFLSPFIRLSIRGHLAGVMKIALIMGVLHFGLMYIAMGMADGVSAIALVAQLNVPFATLCAIFMLKERVGLLRFSAIGVSFMGVMVMGFDPVVFDYIDGLLVMAVSAFCFAIASIYMRQVQDIPAMTIQAWVALMGVAGSFILTLIFEFGQVDMITTASTGTWMAVAYTVLLSTVVGHGGINYLFQKYEVSTVAPYLLMMPFFAVAAGILMLDDILTPRMIIGGLLIFIGVTVVTVRNRQKTKSSPFETGQGGQA